MRKVDWAETLAHSILGFALSIGAAGLGLAAVNGTWGTGATT